MSMKYFTLSFFLSISVILFAQTDHQIDAQAMAWSPNDITIEVGDSVTWINNGTGSHNLNGTTATFPANPESFGDLNVGTNWVFGKRFNIPGVYLYRCDPHSVVMTGKVTVVDPAAAIKPNQLTQVSISPNPAKDVIRIQSGSSKNTVVIYDMLGNKVLNTTLENQSQLDISRLNTGVYMVEVYSTNGYAKMKLIKR